MQNAKEVNRQDSLWVKPWSWWIFCFAHSRHPLSTFSEWPPKGNDKRRPGCCIGGKSRPIFRLAHRRSCGPLHWRKSVSKERVLQLHASSLIDCYIKQRRFFLDTSEVFPEIPSFELWILVPSHKQWQTDARVRQLENYTLSSDPDLRERLQPVRPMIQL